MTLSLWNCEKSWSPLQRRTSRQFRGVMGGLVAASTATALFHSPSSGTPSAFNTWFFAILPMLPLIAAVLVARRYLAEETDEFVKALAIRAMLSGLAITVMGDVLVGSVAVATHFVRIPWALMTADLFVVATMMSFRVMRRAYR